MEYSTSPDVIDVFDPDWKRPEELRVPDGNTQFRVTTEDLPTHVVMPMGPTGPIQIIHKGKTHELTREEFFRRLGFED